MGCSQSAVKDKQDSLSAALADAIAKTGAFKVYTVIKKVVVLRNSITGAASFSNKALDSAIAQIKASYPEAEIIERDLVKNQVPFLTEETTLAIRNGTVETDAQKAADALATELIDELKNANLILIGLPRYNFGVPTSFKTYLDYVARPKVTFKYVDGKPKGLLPNIPVWNVMSAGGIYGEDYYNEWLNAVLPFIGLTNLASFPIEGVAMGKGDESLLALDEKFATELKKFPKAPTPAPAPEEKKEEDAAPAVDAAVVPAAAAEEKKEETPAVEAAPVAEEKEEAAAPVAEEKKEEAAPAPAAEEAAPAADAVPEEKKEEVPAVEAAPIAEEKKEEAAAPAPEEKEEAAPAAEEAAPAVEEKKEEEADEKAQSGKKGGKKGKK